MGADHSSINTFIQYIQWEMKISLCRRWESWSYANGWLNHLWPNDSSIGTDSLRIPTVWRWWIKLHILKSQWWRLMNWIIIIYCIIVYVIILAINVFFEWSIPVLIHCNVRAFVAMEYNLFGKILLIDWVSLIHSTNFSLGRRMAFLILIYFLKQKSQS